MSEHASAPAAATRFGRGAAPHRRTGGPAAQPQLTVRDRQRHHMLAQWVEQLRSQEGAGGIHAAKMHHNGSRTTFEIIFDDGRRQASSGDPGAAPRRGTSPRQLPTQGQAPLRTRQPARERSTAGGDSRSSSDPAANKQRRAMDYDPEDDASSAHDPFLRWRATLCKREAKEIERGAKSVITDLVRSLGGSEQTGGQLLQPAREGLTFGDHLIRSLRVPTGSQASECDSHELELMILETWFEFSDDPEEGAQKIRRFMTPSPSA